MQHRAIRQPAVNITRSIGAAVAACAMLLAAHPAQAFKIDPWSYRPFGVSPRGIESQLESLLYNPRMLLLGPIAMGVRVPAAMGQLKEAVHENLTELSIRCARAPLARASTAISTTAGTAPGVDAPGMITRCAGRSGPLQSHAAELGEEAEEIIRAVRFNDAPPVKTARALMALVTPSALICGEVRVPENAACWALLMAHAAGLAATDPANPQFGRSGNFLYRSHFGDMQFMHAMAARGETLAQSRARVLLWAKFTYQVAGGEIAADAHIGALPEFTPVLAGFEKVTVSEFFEIRGGTAPERIRRIAQGALLHTIQDSFAEGHAEREISAPVRTESGETVSPERFGAISAMRDFTCQSDEKHGSADRAMHYAWFSAAAHGSNSPVTLGANLIDLIERKIKWDDALVAGKDAALHIANSSAAARAPNPATVAQFMGEAVFPITEAKSAVVAGAGVGFLRVKAPVSAAQAGTDVIPGTFARETAIAASDCKE